MVFDQDYYTLIESSFHNLFKYLIIIAILSKSKKIINTLKNSLSAIPYQDNFVELFNSLFINFDFENSYALIQSCKDSIKNDYFLSDYVEQFVIMGKELIIENYITLNSCIDVNLFAGYFKESMESVKRDLVKFIKINYPGAEINENQNVISFKLDDDNDEAFVI